MPPLQQGDWGTVSTPTTGRPALSLQSLSYLGGLAANEREGEREPLGPGEWKKTYLLGAKLLLGAIVYFISAKNYRDARDDGC